jgi:hypothetical protein
MPAVDMTGKYAIEKLPRRAGATPDPKLGLRSCGSSGTPLTLRMPDRLIRM